MKSNWQKARIRHSIEKQPSFSKFKNENRLVPQKVHTFEEYCVRKLRNVWVAKETTLADLV